MTATQAIRSAADPRLLVFFPRGASSDEIEEGFRAVRAATEKTVELVDSLAWYESRFASCGNWNSWALEAVTGRSYRHRRSYFDGFVVTGGESLGQGTAKVALLALSLHKPVYWLDRTKLKTIAKVTSSDGGWHISTGDSP